MYNAIILPGLQLICCCPDQLKRIKEGFSLSYSLCACACSARDGCRRSPPPLPSTQTHPGIGWRTQREVTVTSGFNVLLLSPWWLMQAMTVKCLKWQSASTQLSNPQHCELSKELSPPPSHVKLICFFFLFYRNWEIWFNHVFWIISAFIRCFSRHHRWRFLNDRTCFTVVFGSNFRRRWKLTQQRRKHRISNYSETGCNARQREWICRFNYAKHTSHNSLALFSPTQ